MNGLKHQKEKRSMDHFAGLDVSVKETSVLNLSPISRQGRGKDCSTSSSNPMMEGP